MQASVFVSSSGIGSISTISNQIRRDFFENIKECPLATTVVTAMFICSLLGIAFTYIIF